MRAQIVSTFDHQRVSQDVDLRAAHIGFSTIRNARRLARPEKGSRACE